MAPMKRKASSAAGAVAKKATCVKASVLKKCSVIEAALLAAESYPTDALKIVSENLTRCLGVPKEDRHPFQVKIIEMVGEVLSSVEASFQQNVGNAEDILSKASSEKAAREHALEAAASDFSSTTEATEAAKLALDQGTEASRAGKVVLAEAETAQNQSNKELEDSRDKRAKLESALTELLTPLEEGSLSGNSAKGKISLLMKLAHGFQLDASMLVSLPATLSKAPGDRGTFDTLVCQQFKEELNRHIKSIEGIIVDACSKAACTSRNVDAAKAQLEAARTNEEACRERFNESKTKVEAAKAEHKRVTTALAMFASEMKHIEKNLAAAKASLAAFSSGAMAAYTELLEVTSKPAAKEIPAPAVEGAYETEVPVAVQ